MPRTVYHPVLESTTKNGQSVRAKMNVGTNPPVARQGERVNVIYDPGHPSDAEIARKGWFRPTLLLFLGILGPFFTGLFVIVAL